MEDFETYLAAKKIDSKAFREGDPEKWQEFKALFEQVHPTSFTAQKLFLINSIRRSYPLKAADQPEESAKPKVRPKPKFKVPAQRPKQD